MGRWWQRMIRAWAPPVVELIDIVDPVSPREQLRLLAAEAVIRQDEAVAVLAAIRRREPLGYVAPRAGPLVRRFFALRDSLPVCRDADDVRIAHVLSVVLHHDAMLLAMAQDLLAYEWRSERIRHQLDRLDGLGEPADRLDEIYRELCRPGPDPVSGLAA